MLSTFFSLPLLPSLHLSGLGSILLASITAPPIHQVFPCLFWPAILCNTCVNSSTCKFRQPRLRLFLSMRTPSFGLMSDLFARHLSVASLRTDFFPVCHRNQVSRLSRPSDPPPHRLFMNRPIAHLSATLQVCTIGEDYPWPTVRPATRLCAFVRTSSSPSSLWKVRKIRQQSFISPSRSSIKRRFTARYRPHIPFAFKLARSLLQNLQHVHPPLLSTAFYVRRWPHLWVTLLPF